jgi:hypothetical protein
MTGIMQMLTGGTPAAPTVIGQAFGGGYYAGKIAAGGGGVATHYLIVAPKATGQSSLAYGGFGTLSSATSLINGPSNTSILVGLGTQYAAANFCNNLNTGSGLNGYTDWYMPAQNELEVLYYFLKPDTTANNTSYGANANAVSPEPISTNYSSGSPAQTSAGINFRSGESQAFDLNFYRASTDVGAYDVRQILFATGGWVSSNPGADPAKYEVAPVRAVRRISI